MCLFVLCVACLTVLVNCLVKQFVMCLGVIAIMLLNVMDVFSVCGGALLDRPCMVSVLSAVKLYIIFFGFRVELGFLNFDDDCMCVVNKQFELLEFVSESVYVDLQYEISLTFTAESVWC